MSSGSAWAAALRAAIDIGVAQLDATLRVALQRCGPMNAKNLRSVQYHSTVAASRHTFIAAARRLRCVRADVFEGHLHGDVEEPVFVLAKVRGSSLSHSKPAS
jgi:hypothetical protein